MAITINKYATVAIALTLSAGSSLAAPQCIAKDAKGKAFLSLEKGQIIKFVKENDALLRNINAQGMPHLLGKIESVDLASGCQATLFGNGGATWGHMHLKKSGPTGVPAKHVYAFQCECK